MKKSKINTVEMIYMFLFVLAADGAEFLGNLAIAIPIIGAVLPIIAGFFGAAISAIMIFWLYNKGVSIKWFLGGSGIELIPFINALPIRTAALIMTIISDQAPIINKISEITQPGGPTPSTSQSQPTKPDEK